jgi:hypothetical protein
MTRPLAITPMTARARGKVAPIKSASSPPREMPSTAQKSRGGRMSSIA